MEIDAEIFRWVGIFAALTGIAKMVYKLWSDFGVSAEGLSTINNWMNVIYLDLS